MLQRFVILAALGAVPAAFGPGFAFSVPLKIPHPSASLRTVADGDRWRSPASLSAEFPKLGASDCSAYGSRYGYAECGRTSVTPAHSTAVTAPSGVTVSLVQEAKRTASSGGGTARRLREANAQPAQSMPAEPMAIPVRRPRFGQDPAAPSLFGPLLLARFHGTSPSDPDAIHVAEALHDGRLAGVVLDEENAESVTQVRELVRALQEAGAGRPVIVAVDQPGGSDAPLSETKGFRGYAPANLIANGQSPYQAQLIYRDMASDLAATGINMNIGPSADVCQHTGLIPSANCFGTSAGSVAAFANAFNFGHHDKGVLAALRHSPLISPRRHNPATTQAAVAILGEIMKRQPSDAFVVGLPSRDELEVSSVLPLLTGDEPRELFRNSGFDGALILDLPVREEGLWANHGLVLGMRMGADIVILPRASPSLEDPVRMAQDTLAAASSAGQIAPERIQSALRRAAALVKRLEDFKNQVRIAASQ